ncbi:G-type lectin S-receptor-like serine/threonine-protein kinase At4g27290 [Curcuma longa]|uniref:G-type lectin S-receptor-like serine/threonine-protein kinase At4g27290 n=1 Tax=Curcuma longa TaxID=136217 RepID=UPI003D9E2582
MRGIAFLLYLLSLFSFSIAGDSLTPTQPLLDDGGSGNLVSAGGRFELGFFSPPGTQNRYVGIWYHNISDKAIVWVANRQSPISGASGRLSLTSNGTLVVTDGNSMPFWSSSSSSSSNSAFSPVVRLHDDGNLVISDGRNNDSVSWQSFDFPTDTFLSGMRFGRDHSSGYNVNFTSWASTSDPAPGSYVLGVNLDGVPQEFVWDGSEQPVGRLGPWNGAYMSGAPTTNLQDLVDYYFEVSSRKLIYWYTVRDPSVLVRATVTPQGSAQVLMWVEGSQSWTQQDYYPRDPCDHYAQCGPNGVCDPTGSAICRCLQGFQPKNPRNWAVWEWRDGCVRKTELDCGNTTDGFFAFSNVKLPDSSWSTVDWSTQSLDDCKASCLRNCSCTAYARANISGSGSGSGCIFWTTNLTDIKHYSNGFGQDLYVRLAQADLESMSSGHGNKRSVAVIVAAPLVATFLLATAVTLLWRRRKTRNNKRKHRADEEEAVEEENLDMPLFDLGTIAESTEDFCVDNKLGEGGFGPVYKGKLKEGQEIAVKRLSKTSTQGTDEFKNEVMVIAKLQHRNLVRLLGCCIQGGERMLIYEYMLNGSLDTFLFDKDRCRLLDWGMRYNIILGIARGLLYLHHDSRYRIIHRDLKTSNILLDENMNPKISDFGMAKLFGGDETIGNTKRVVGTYGYMSPEYAMNGIFSVKSDVFSFGVLMLEIITGKQNNGAYQSIHHQNLLGEIWSLWKENRVAEIVDDSIHHSCPFDEVLTCIKVGLLCVQERSEDRPIMSVVLQMLGSNSSLLPEPKQPGFVVTGNQKDNDSSGALLSINRLSVTILEGR